MYNNMIYDIANVIYNMILLIYSNIQNQSDKTNVNSCNLKYSLKYIYYYVFLSIFKIKTVSF